MRGDDRAHRGMARVEAAEGLAGIGGGLELPVTTFDDEADPSSAVIDDLRRIFD